MKLSPSVDLITYLLTDSQFYFIEGNKPIDLQYKKYKLSSDELYLSHTQL